eukprot:m.464359 g.464359  ORF g.464359 m.464359 type:complete len:176 (+) comp23466_c0_seq1:762-1289(+)
MSYTLVGNDSFVTVDEHFRTGSRESNDAWLLDLSAGLKSTGALGVSTHICDLADPYSQPNLTGPTKVSHFPIKPNKRLGNYLGIYFTAGIRSFVFRNSKTTTSLRWPAGTGFSFSELGASVATPTINSSGKFLGMRWPIYTPAPDPIGGRRVYLIVGHNSVADSQRLPHFLVEQS